MENNQILLDLKLVGNIKGTFIVPSYQRGYRWGKEDVLRLLNDVYSNGGKKYCLQPVVVRRNGESYDLIDGQQRLTTLYLIYRYLNMKDVTQSDCEPTFSLEYETRENSAEFLRDIDMSRRNENIDFWFIANAYEAIRKWFEKDSEVEKQNQKRSGISRYFKENVMVIWYEVGEKEDANSLFTRLNIGKIPLTNAELVKAMFLSRRSSETSDGMDQRKREEISLQWDNIEKELHNDSLWYFLTNRTNTRYQTRIDLILDLISEPRPDEMEKYYTFFKFDKIRKAKSLDELWHEIQKTFLVLKGWYEDHEFYHKIGYLVASEQKQMTLQDIFKVSKGETKDRFRKLLNSYISKSIAIGKNYADLSYENPEDYKHIRKLLLLFNVESVRRNGEFTQWFPFDMYKFDARGRCSWSLEHIHAQHSDGLRTEEMWREWLRMHIPSVLAVAKDAKDAKDVEQANAMEKLAKEMQTTIDKPKLRGDEFNSLHQKVIERLSVQGNVEYLHSISNLALLKRDDNSALNKATFDVKRNLIVNMDKEGKFIPFCTKMVFLKYYTPSEKNQLHFWGPSDRIAYINAINEVLATYLSEPIEITEVAK